MGGGGSYAAGATVVLTAAGHRQRLCRLESQPLRGQFRHAGQQPRLHRHLQPQQSNLAQYTVGLFNPATSTFYLKNSHAGGAADVVFGFRPGQRWLDPTGRRLGRQRHRHRRSVQPRHQHLLFKNSHAGGVADVVFGFGPANAGWTSLVGDWDGTATVGLFNPPPAPSIQEQPRWWRG